MRLHPQDNLVGINGYWEGYSARRQLGRDLIADDGSIIHVYAVGFCSVGVRPLYVRDVTGRRFVSRYAGGELEEIESAAVDNFSRAMADGPG